MEVIIDGVAHETSVFDVSGYRAEALLLDHRDIIQLASLSDENLVKITRQLSGRVVEERMTSLQTMMHKRSLDHHVKNKLYHVVDQLRKDLIVHGFENDREGERIVDRIVMPIVERHLFELMRRTN